MDYHRIYRDFIADRKAKPKPDGYTERHHIVPRSLGGSDDADNLIDLTAEDHFFSHLLLAKMHGGGMWLAVIRMSASRSEGRRSWVRHRYMYGAARRKYAEYASALFSGRPGLKGAENGNYNPTVYSWVNLDTGEERQSTLHDMWQVFGGSRATWTGAASGSKTSAFGWIVKSRPVRIRGTKGFRHRFVNRDGRVFEGTQKEFCIFAGVNDASSWRVVHKSSVTSCGWRLLGTADRSHNAPKDGSRPGVTAKVFRLTKGDIVIEGDRHFLAGRLEATPQQVSAALYAIRSGQVSSYKGWSLAA